MYCPYCGTESAVQSGYCQSCGANLSQNQALPQDQTNKCPSCSTENDPLAKFCKSCGSKVSEQADIAGLGQIPMPPPPTVDYAGFWRRFVAFIIDMIFLTIIGKLLGFITGSPAVSPAGFTGFSDISHIFFSIGSLTNVVIGWLYYALMESSIKQGTLGKMALGLVVTDMNGNRVSFLRATGRHFAKILSMLIMMIGYIMIGFTARKQALHDMIAGCLVLVRR